MDLNTRLQNVTVLGAGGKMGSGIATLLLQEMARLRMTPEYKDTKFKLNLIDVNEDLLDGLKGYLRDQLRKVGEKTCVGLRQAYCEREDLVENYDIIDQYIEDAMIPARFSNILEAAKGSHMIFEAIIENEKIKIKVFKKLSKICGPDTYYFTNTSSIPIKTLDEGAGLDGRIIGYHFYNPPVVQKLAELISSENTKPELIELSKEIAKRLRKTIVPSRDIAGFIGNGYFMRDGLYAIDEVLRLKKEHGFPGAVYALDKVGRDFLVRPMGIFQLIDYVGVDVFQLILKVMNGYLPDQGLHSKLIDKMIKLGVKGGQRSDGSQKDGFLKYQGARPVAVYDPDKKDYVEFDKEGWTKDVEDMLGTLPDKHVPWKMLLMDRKKEEKLAPYFAALKTTDTKGAKLANSYIEKFREIGKTLVDMGVAEKPEDVDSVLQLGFYHLYGPFSPVTE
jgi:3-hydroxyacyl-CoA dehydrogenase